MNDKKDGDTLARLLAINCEIEREKRLLRQLGLTEEEIDGYVEFFAENFFGNIDPPGGIN